MIGRKNFLKTDSNNFDSQTELAPNCDKGASHSQSRAATRKLGFRIPFLIHAVSPVPRHRSRSRLFFLAGKTNLTEVCFRKFFAIQSWMCVFPIFFLLPFFISCQASLPQAHSQETVRSSTQSQEDYLYEKLLADAQANKLTHTQANEAFLLAKSFEYKSQFDRAEKLLEAHYKFSPNSPVAINLIQVKIALKKITEAKEVAKHSHVLFPKNQEILLMLIQIYQIENNQVQVASLLDEAIKEFPKNESFAILYAYYNRSNAKKVLTSFLARSPESPNVLLKLSVLYFQEKNYSEALKFAKKSYVLDSDNVDTINHIARIYQAQKNNAQAEFYYRLTFEKDMENNGHAQNYINILLAQKKQQEALSVLLKLESNSDVNAPFPPEFTFEIGRILLINEDYKGAKIRFQSLIGNTLDTNISDDEVLFFLGYVNENLHKFKEAIDCFEKIHVESKFYTLAMREKILTTINSGNQEKGLELLENFRLLKEANTENTLFYVSVLSYFKKNEQAIEILNKSIQENPNQKELYLKRLELYFISKKDEQFVTREALLISKKWPQYADGLNMVGYLLINYSSKNHKLAESLLKKALSLDPKNSYYLDSLGSLYLKKNNPLLAQGYFLDALKISPNEPLILYHYAQVLKLLNKAQEAEKIIEKTRIIMSNMLIYSLESDAELKALANTLSIKLPTHLP
jgi:tetratricopeptide (TPR) repeat protein